MPDTGGSHNRGMLKLTLQHVPQPTTDEPIVQGRNAKDPRAN